MTGLAVYAYSGRQRQGPASAGDHIRRCKAHDGKSQVGDLQHPPPGDFGGRTGPRSLCRLGKPGDRSLEPGRCLGMTTLLVETGYGAQEKETTQAHYVMKDLSAAVACILRLCATTP